MDVGALTVSAILSVSVAVPAAGIGLAVRDEGPVGLSVDAWRRGAAGSVPGTLAIVAACVVTAVTVGVRVGQSSAMPALVVSAVLGVVLAVVDVRRRRLPFLLSSTICASCLLIFVVASASAGTFGPLLRSVLAGGATFVAFLLLALAFAGQLGLGDVFFVAALTVSLGWLGWSHVVLGLMAGLVAQFGVLALVRLTRRGGTPTTVPMAPGLVAGWVLAVLLPVT